MGVSVHRVVVRGQFADLTADQRDALLAEVAEHDIFKSSFTEWGTFTYDDKLVAFNFRYEIRVDPEADGNQDPAALGLARATAQLMEWGLGHKHMRSTSAAMSDMWTGD